MRARYPVDGGIADSSAGTETKSATSEGGAIHRGSLSFVDTTDEPGDVTAPWLPLTRREVARAMAGVDAMWWFTGGIALALHVGASWRRHHDIDIGIRRDQLGALTPLLDTWQVFLASGGTLSRWNGEGLAEHVGHNNLWVRRPDGGWGLDITIGSGNDAQWIFRRDETLTLPWSVAIRTGADGAKYLSPELQLLFKSSHVRPKDDQDARIVIPTLDRDAIELLATWLPPDHGWRTMLGASWTTVKAFR